MRFRIRGDAAVSAHRRRTGVVGGQGQVEIVVEHVEHPPQVTASATDIIDDIERIDNIQFGRSSGNQLHHAHGPLAADRFRFEIALDLDHRTNQGLVQAVEPGEIVDDVIDAVFAAEIELPVALERGVGKDDGAVGSDLTVDFGRRRPGNRQSQAQDQACRRQAFADDLFHTEGLYTPKGLKIQQTMPIEFG